MSALVGANPVFQAREIYRTIEQLRREAQSPTRATDLFSIYHQAINILDVNISRVFSVNKICSKKDRAEIDDFKIFSEVEISAIFGFLISSNNHKSDNYFVLSEIKYKKIKSELEHCYFFDTLNEIRESFENDFKKEFRLVHLLNREKTNRKIFEITTLVFGFKREIHFLLDDKERNMLEEEARFPGSSSRNSTELLEIESNEKLSLPCKLRPQNGTDEEETIFVFEL